MENQFADQALIPWIECHRGRFVALNYDNVVNEMASRPYYGIQLLKTITSVGKLYINGPRY